RHPRASRQGHGRAGRRCRGQALHRTLRRRVLPPWRRGRSRLPVLAAAIDQRVVTAPPLTLIAWPVMCRAPGEARKNTVSAMSSGRPSRLFLVASSNAVRRSPVIRPWKNSVPAMKPGETALGVMPPGPSSADRSTFHAATAALAAPYEPPPEPRSAAIELSRTTVPPSASRSDTAVVVSTALTTFAARLD